MKNCLLFLAIRKEQIKTILRYHLTFIRMLRTKHLTTNAKGNINKKGVPINCWFVWKLVQLLWKSVWRILKKVKVNLAQDTTMTLLDRFFKYYTTYYRDGIFLKYWISYFTGPCLSIFFAALYTGFRKWKQLNVLQLIKG